MSDLQWFRAMLLCWSVGVLGLLTYGMITRVMHDPIEYVPTIYTMYCCGSLAGECTNSGPGYWHSYVGVWNKGE